MSAGQSRRLRLRILPDRLAVCRLATDAALPDWLSWNAGLVAVTRTAHELSILCSEAVVPEGVDAAAGWRAFEVEGPLEFALTGILSGLATPLAEAGISIFALSTYDTDYVLVREADLERAKSVLAQSCDIIEA